MQDQLRELVLVFAGCAHPVFVPAEVEAVLTEDLKKILIDKLNGLRELRQIQGFHFITDHLVGFYFRDPSEHQLQAVMLQRQFHLQEESLKNLKRQNELFDEGERWKQGGDDE